MQYTWDRYHSICSSIKSALEITADNYFVTSNGAVYDAIQAAYIVLLIMGYLRISCQPSTIILHTYVYLPICMFCSCVCMCERTTRNTQSWNMNKITDVRALTCTSFHFIRLYMMEKYACFHMGLVRSISRPIHGIARQMGSFNLRGHFGQ